MAELGAPWIIEPWCTGRVSAGRVFLTCFWPVSDPFLTCFWPVSNLFLIRSLCDHSMCEHSIWLYMWTLYVWVLCESTLCEHSTSALYVWAASASTLCVSPLCSWTRCCPTPKSTRITKNEHRRPKTRELPRKMKQHGKVGELPQKMNIQHRKVWELAGKMKMEEVEPPQSQKSASFFVKTPFVWSEVCWMMGAAMEEENGEERQSIQFWRAVESDSRSVSN